MRLKSTLVLLAMLAGCGDDDDDTIEEPIVPDQPNLPPRPPIVDPNRPDAGDGGVRDGSVIDGSLIDAAPDAPPPRPTELTTISVTRALGISTTVRGVAVDQGGGIWATTDAQVYYQNKGRSVRTYSAADGLATGDTSAKFEGIGAGKAGQAFIGSWGKFVDIIDVDGAGRLDINHVFITDPVHTAKVTIGFRLVADLGAAYGGTLSIGAEHGHSAMHGINSGYCFDRIGCFEEHRHSDPSGNPAGDVKGIAVCQNHDVWTGDGEWIARMPYGADGETPDFWASPPEGYPNTLTDVWPGTSDAVGDMVCDSSNRLWIGSFGNGVARYEISTGELTYWDASDALPDNRVVAVLEDTDGSIWFGTWGGIARRKADGSWVYYGEAKGLPSDVVTSFAIDKTTTPRTIYIGSTEGLHAYQGE